MGLIQEDTGRLYKSEVRLGGNKAAIRIGGCSQNHAGKWEGWK